MLNLLTVVPHWSSYILKLLCEFIVYISQSSNFNMFIHFLSRTLVPPVTGLVYHNKMRHISVIPYLPSYACFHFKEHSVAIALLEALTGLEAFENNTCHKSQVLSDWYSGLVHLYHSSVPLPAHSPGPKYPILYHYLPFGLAYWTLRL